MILYKSTKSMIRSSDEDTDFFDIVAGILEWNILAQFLFIICLYYVLQTTIDLMK